MTKYDNIKFREEFIKKQFKNTLGYDLNISEPKTFNEKLQWLKLYYHNPVITKCADKYLVREYVKEKIGEEYLIPILGVWDNPDDIDFDSLPNQFVLKVNWGSGQNVVVEDKSKLNLEAIRKKLKYWMEPFSNHYYYSFEWQYKNIQPKIICEKYIKINKEKSFEIHMLCFNNNIKYIYSYILGGSHDSKYEYIIYDENWNKQPMFFYEKFDYDNKYMGKPKHFELMKKLANKLSSDFPFVRVDFYYIDEIIYFGELTFTPGAGYNKYISMDWEYNIGALLELPEEKKIEYDVLDIDTFINQSAILEPLCMKYKVLEDYQNANIQNYNDLYNKYNIMLENYNCISNKYNTLLKTKTFNLLTLFNFNIFSICKNNKYFILTLFGIKITLKK